ncbi:hypothetical protein Dimus_017639 [Dionaea muscipula]
MPSGVFLNLNTAYCSWFRSAVVGKRSCNRNSIDLLTALSRTFEGRSSTLKGSPLAYGRSLSYNRGDSRPSKHRSISSLCTPIRGNSMATSGSQAVSGDVYVEKSFSSHSNVFYLAKPNFIFLCDKRHDHFQKASLRLIRGELSGACLSYGHINPGKRWRSSVWGQIIGPCSTNFGRSAAVHGTAHDLSFDLSSTDEQLEDQRDSSEQAITGKETLSLRSGPCYLPHPDKEKTGGEDAHFICVEEHVIGIADGVGGWADVGVDAGEYARRLMSNSVIAIKEELMGSIDPLKVLEKAHSLTKVRGSSTACIIALSNEVIHAINLGDSGFLIIRDGSTVFRSPVQQYGFNFPYQLESGTAGDVPSSGQEML